MKRLSQAGNDLVPARRRAVAAFAVDEGGSLVIFGLFVLILMLAAAGLGVDFMRMEAQRTRLQATLDRAVLAAASLDQPLDADDVVLDYFARAGLGDYITADDVHSNELTTSRRVSATAHMDMGTTFLRFAGINELGVPAAGAAEETAGETEISLVLDVSGSMGSWSSGSTKIAILRTAATQFVNIVMCNPSDPTETENCTVTDGTVSVNLIPYAEQVLAGEALLDQFSVSNEHDYSSCVTFAASDFSTTAITMQQPLQRTGHFDPWSNSKKDASDWTCPPDAWREISPVNGNAASLRTRIAALNADGNTSIDVGMKWASALLDPEARPAISALAATGGVSADFDDRPIAWDNARVKKVIVLMTDGVNTSQHYLYDNSRSGPSLVWKAASSERYSIYRPSYNKYYWAETGTWEDHPYGAGTESVCGWVQNGWLWSYQCNDVPEDEGGAVQLTFPELWAKKPWAWYDSFSWLPSPGSYYGTSTKNTRLQAICDAAKDQNIRVFTVGFEVTSSSATVLRNCASAETDYFNVAGNGLTTAFAQIARQITKLRLVN